VADRSYLAFVRPTPPPFSQFVSGHFPPGTCRQRHRHRGTTGLDSQDFGRKQQEQRRKAHYDAAMDTARVRGSAGRSCRLPQLGKVALVAFAVVPIAVTATEPGAAAPAGLDIEWVTVGDPGNPPDAATGRGGVAGVYQISKHEITVAQYAAFLSAVAAGDPHGLWNAGQKIDRGGTAGAFTYTASNGHEREPVMMVSFNDAMRFANWMHHLHAPHGGPQATPSVADDVAPLTETGAYDLPAGRDLAARSPGARVWIPNEDEWYKAAYYQPHAAGGPPGHYWRFPTKSDAIPALGKPGDTGTNLASFLADATLLQNLTTKRGYNDVMPVGSFPGSTSYFGTVDQAGNAWEWVEPDDGNPDVWIVRGGDYRSGAGFMACSARYDVGIDDGNHGFRVVAPAP